MDNETKEDVVYGFIRARNALYDHLGFQEDWTAYPLNFETLDCQWCLLPNNKIRWGNEKTIEMNDYCEADIFPDRFYPNGSVFTGEKYTMIFGEPHVDGMIWAYVFKNDLRVSLIEKKA